MRNASRDCDLDHGSYYWVAFRIGWIVKVCRTNGNSLGGPALPVGLPGGIEVLDRRNRDFGRPWIAGTVIQTIGGDYIDGRDGRRPGYSPDTRRSFSITAAVDLRRIVLWTLQVAASGLRQSVRPPHHQS